MHCHNLKCLNLFSFVALGDQDNKLLNLKRFVANKTAIIIQRWAEAIVKQEQVEKNVELLAIGGCFCKWFVSVPGLQSMLRNAAPISNPMISQVGDPENSTKIVQHFSTNGHLGSTSTTSIRRHAYWRTSTQASLLYLVRKCAGVRLIVLGQALLLQLGLCSVFKI